MRHIPVIYSRSTALAGLLIRNADRFGRWSHCGVVTPQDTVLEARFMDGVVETPIKTFKERCSHWYIRHIVVPYPEHGIEWFRHQKGKKYDFLAVFGLMFRRSWQEPDRWHCAEIVEQAIGKAGRPRFTESTNRISPNMSSVVI